MSGTKYRVRCIGRIVYGTEGVSTVVKDQWPSCGWTGVRTDSLECECYDIWTLYCRPMSPGPGCPRGIDWPCPKCKGAVSGRPVEHRVKAVST
jgi:hypothetical protein